MNLVIPILVGLALAAGLFLIFYGLDTAIGPDEDLEDRLNRFTGVGKAETAGQAALKKTATSPDTESSAPTSPVATRVDRAIAQRSFAQNLAVDLGRADLKLTPGEFLILNGMSVVFVAMLLFAIGGFSPLMALPGAAIGFFLPRIWLARRKSARLKAFNDQLGDTLTLLANSLRSGYSLLQAMQLVSRESPPPIGTEFRRVVREVGLGVPPEDALNNLVLRIRSDDLDLMVTAINVQREVGGNLSQILETIGLTIRERVRIKGEISTLTAQQSTAGYVIAAIPVLLTLILFLINSDYMLPMFQPPWIVMPICGVLMLMLGFFAIKKITDIKV